MAFPAFWDYVVITYIITYIYYIIINIYILYYYVVICCYFGTMLLFWDYVVIGATVIGNSCCGFPANECISMMAK